ncbi:MAG TPA: hypothetical protein VF635_01330 [Propionibacteriaceae bacterium]
MIVDEVQFVVGVDTHVDTHTAALCDVRGRPMAEHQVPTTPAGYAELAAWARAVRWRLSARERRVHL